MIKLSNLIPQFLRRKSVTKTLFAEQKRIREIKKDFETFGPDFEKPVVKENLTTENPRETGDKPLSLKTRRDWFNTLSEPYRTQAFENNANPDTSFDTMVNGSLDQNCKSLWGAFANGFRFDRTPEGREYWIQVQEGSRPRIATTTYNEGGTQYPWRLVKSTKHKVMYFLKANYPNSYSGREIARATGLNTSQIGGALKHCGDHVKKVGTHVGSKGCVGFKWQGVLKERK